MLDRRMLLVSATSLVVVPKVLLAAPVPQPPTTITITGEAADVFWAHLQRMFDIHSGKISPFDDPGSPPEVNIVAT